MPFLSLPGVHVDSLADTAYLALAATALGLTVGPAGLPSLGTGAFMAIGAFTSALLVARSGWPLEPAVLAGTAAALVAGVLCGGVVRLRRAFVAVSTWLLAWLVWLFLLAVPVGLGRLAGTDPAAALAARARRDADRALRGRARPDRADGARGRGRAARRARAGALGAAPGAGARDLARRPARARGGSARSRRPRRSPGSRAASPSSCQAVADPVSYDPFLSFKLLVAVLLGGAAATLGPAVGVIAARPDRPGLGPARARAAAAARALRRGGRGAPARLRARLRRPGRRAVGAAPGSRREQPPERRPAHAAAGRARAERAGADARPACARPTAA